MAKSKSVFFCKECGYESAKWMGQCPGCREWNTFTEEPVTVSAAKRSDSGLSRKAPAEKTVVKRSTKSAAHKVSVRKAAGKPVAFTIHGEKGRAVYLAGEFNNWDPTARKMAYKARSGIYTATVKLAPGSYQYKFVIDGTWCADPENVTAVPNDHGTFNSVVTVK